MPEYLAPGVYVEETSFRSKSIEGVSTTTTGFVGPTAYGPVKDEPEILTSLGDFEQTYGKGNLLRFADDGSHLNNEDDQGGGLTWKPMTNYMWQAVRSFFDNGGSRLYVKRIYRGIPIKGQTDPEDPTQPKPDDGRASKNLSGAGAGDPVLRIQARHPGAAGGRTVKLTLSRGRSILSSAVNPTTGNAQTQARGLVDRDVVLLEQPGANPPQARSAMARLRALADGT